MAGSGVEIQGSFCAATMRLINTEVDIHVTISSNSPAPPPGAAIVRLTKNASPFVFSTSSALVGAGKLVKVLLTIPLYPFLP